jgi:ABC-type branched-subunit amino acid transport system permease subunit
MAIFGIALIVTIVFSPTGLVGVLERLTGRGKRSLPITTTRH